MTDDLESLHQQLRTAREVLAILKRQAAGYTSLNIPPQLEIQLKEKQAQVWDLQRRIRNLEDRRQAETNALPQIALCGALVILMILAISALLSGGKESQQQKQPLESILMSRGSDQLVYCSRIGSSGDFDIVLQDLQSGERMTLAKVVGGDTGSPTWSPDGNQVIFGSKFEGYSQLHLFDLTTGYQRVLTTSPYDKGQPSWSPDGKYVVYAVRRPSKDMDLLILDLQQGKELQLTYYPGNVQIWGPKWSPDGKTIALWSNLALQSNHFEIYLLAFPPKTLPIAPNDLYLWSTDPDYSEPDNDEQFVWSPDGKRFAFINKATKDNERYFDILVGEFDLVGDLDRWPVKDGALYRIPDPDMVFEAAPAWSPDSTRIAFHRVMSGDLHKGPKDIIVFDLKTRTSENVTQTPDVDDRWPAWRPHQ